MLRSEMAWRHDGRSLGVSRLRLAGAATSGSERESLTWRLSSTSAYDATVPGGSPELHCACPLTKVMTYEMYLCKGHLAGTRVCRFEPRPLRSAAITATRRLGLSGLSPR
jgi:hypothetical protein